MRILSTMGLAGVLRGLGPDFEARSGIALDATLLPTVKLLEQIRGGDRADLAIMTDDGIDDLITEGVLETRIDVAWSFVGVAMRAGDRRPDITSKDAFVAALLAARSVAVSQVGASGIFIAGLLRRLGIEDAMREKLIVLPSGYTANLLISGQAELAIQQVSELMVVDGVDIVGRLPAELGGRAMFSAALFRDAAEPQAACELVAALTDPALAPLYRSCGLEQAGMAAPNRS